MSLRDQLTSVQVCLTEAAKRPSNEANTCHWVITPLLRDCGYDFHEIDVQAHDGAGKYPDYAILPNTQFTWFLEAKSWTENLADTHVIQAINYAHTHGGRWVVLSNGREWCLYDDHIVGGTPADRLVATAKLNHTDEMMEFLGALSKSSVQSNGVAAYALKSKLAEVLSHQLRSPNSEVVNAVTNTLRSKFGLSTLTTTDLVLFFGTRLAASPTASVALPPQMKPSAATRPTVHTKTAAIGATLSLKQLKASGSNIHGEKPTTIAFPDRTEMTISSWRDVAVETIKWLLTNDKAPVIPFKGRKSGKMYLINSTPIHENGADMPHKTVTVAAVDYYISVQRSAPDFISCLNVLCEEVGAQPSDFLVTLRK